MTSLQHPTDNAAPQHDWKLRYRRPPSGDGFILRLVRPDASTDAADADESPAAEPDDTVAAGAPMQPAQQSTPPVLTVVPDAPPLGASDQRGQDGDPFASTWRDYLACGFAPLPLNAGTKSPPPTGFIGHHGKVADTDQLAQWERAPRYRGGNVCVWFGTTVTVDGVTYQLAGVDVDHYGAKCGGDQLAELINTLGPMADRDPWISSARSDGVSGIRWFLAPLTDANGDRIEFGGKADSAIDVIQRKHRFAVVWPSVHPEGGRYWWFPPATAPDAPGRAAWSAADGLPVPSTFPVLSPSWVAYLRSDTRHDTSGLRIDWDISNTELTQWATDAFNDGNADETCWDIALAVATWKRRITDDESSHDKITDSLWMLYRLAAEGHTGWADAITAVSDHWLAGVLTSGKRSPTEAMGEIWRSKLGALRKVNALVDGQGQPVPKRCKCAEGGADIWHSERVPLGVARQLATVFDRRDAPLKRWRDDWYQYDGTRWRSLASDEFNSLLYDVLESASYLNAKGERMPWNPDENKVRKVSHALRSVVLRDGGTDAPGWDDGRTDHVIAFTNALVRVGDRKQIDHSPAFFNTFVLPFDYEPLAPSPQRWLTFLSQLWPDDRESIDALQEWFGYVLSGRTNLHKMLMLIGPRRSGKTTIAHVLRTLVGRDNQTECRSADLVTQFGLANLIGRSLGIFDDDRITGSGKKFVDILKNIVGEGQATIDRKYQSAWRGRLPVRFVYIANELSAIPDASGAIVSRILPLETRVTFESNPDRGLRKALDAELPGIFNWALDGLDRLTANGEFTEPASTRGLIDDMNDMASPVTEFIDDHCDFKGDEAFVWDEVLFELWKTWCAKSNLQPGSKKSFMAKVRAAYGSRIEHAKRGPRGKQRRGYVGIALKPSHGEIISMAALRSRTEGADDE